MIITRSTSNAGKSLLGLWLGCGLFVGCSSSTPEAASEADPAATAEASATASAPQIARPIIVPPSTVGVTKPSAAMIAAEATLAAIAGIVDRPEGEPTHGNADTARGYAKTFAEQMTEYDQRIVGATLDRTKLNDNYRVWCEMKYNSCLFIVHVPGYKDLTPEAVTLIRDRAYDRAQNLMRGVLRVGGRLGVELRSDGESIEVMTGTCTAPSVVARDSVGTVVKDRKLLLPFIQDRTTAQPIAQTSGHASGLTFGPTNPAIPKATKGTIIDLGDGRFAVVGDVVKPKNKPPRDPKPGPIKTEFDVRIALEDLQPDANSFDRNDAINRLKEVAAPIGPRAEVCAALLAVSRTDGNLRRNRAIEALAVWGDASTVETLKANLATTEDVFERRDIYAVIVKLQGASAIEWLFDQATKNKSNEMAVERALQTLGPEAEPKFILELQSNEPFRQKLACKALGGMGTRASLSYLRKIERNGDKSVQFSAGVAANAIERREEKNAGKLKP